MSEAPRSVARYCPGCGNSAGQGASFCERCGARLGASGGSIANAPRAALTVFIGFLLVGLTLWFVAVAPKDPPGRIALAQKAPEAPDSGASPGGAMPKGHPPIGVPEDVKTYIKELQTKAAANPKDLEAWKIAAEVAYRAGQIDRQYLDKAEASFRRVSELDPKDTEALRGLGNVHFDRGLYPQAIEAYGRYLALKPDDLNVRTDLGTMYLYDGKPDKAIVEYDQVLAKDGKFYQAHYNLGVAHAQKGDSEKALTSFARARELAPDDKAREQIDGMIAEAKGAGAAAGESVAAGPATLAGFVEKSLREHPIVGPKIVAFDWPTPTEGRLRLRDFPMQGMPEMVRTKFLDRVKGNLADAKRETQATGNVRLDLVDEQSGQVMATVTAE